MFWKKMLLLVVLLVAHAILAAADAAVRGLSVAKLRKMEEEDKDEDATKLLKIAEEPERTLYAHQIAMMLTGFFLAALTVIGFASDVTGVCQYKWGWEFVPQPILYGSVCALLLVVEWLIVILFGDQISRKLVSRDPMRYALSLYGVIRGVGKFFYPAVWLAEGSVGGVFRLLKMEVPEEEVATEDEIRMIVDKGSEQGTIEQDEHEWIQNVFEFNDIDAEDVMTREPKVVALSAEAEKDEVLKTIHDSGLSRYPVYGEDLNDVLGILNARDYLLNLTRKKPRTMRELLRPAYFVPESLPADRLFSQMQMKKQHIAIVIDEYGDTSGIVTMEDLLEEIVGNIYDEFDPAEQAEVEKIGDNTWRVSGSIQIPDLAEALQVEIPEDEDYDTLSGMVLDHMDSFPEDGSVFDIEVPPLQIHVTRVLRRHIEQAIVHVMEPETETESEEAE